MDGWTYHKLKAQVAVLRDVEKIYPRHTIGNIIQQIEARIKEYENKEKEE